MPTIVKSNKGRSQKMVAVRSGVGDAQDEIVGGPLDLSYRDLVAIMAERNVAVTHTTIMRWVHRHQATRRRSPCELPSPVMDRRHHSNI